MTCVIQWWHDSFTNMIKYNDDDFFISDIHGNSVLYLKYCNFSQ